MADSLFVTLISAASLMQYSCMPPAASNPLLDDIPMSSELLAVEGGWDVSGVKLARVIQLPYQYKTNRPDFHLAACLPSYEDCLSRAGEWCQNYTINVPVVQRATAYADCVNAYVNNCRATYCD